MPPKRKAKGAKNLGGTISLHFKNLSDDDDIGSLISEVDDSKAPYNLHQISSNPHMTDVDINSNAMDAFASQLSSDPLSQGPSYSKFMEVGDPSPSSPPHSFTEDVECKKQAPPRPLKPPNREFSFKNKIHSSSIEKKLELSDIPNIAVGAAEDLNESKEIQQLKASPSLSAPTQCVTHPLVLSTSDNEEEDFDDMSETPISRYCDKADQAMNTPEVSTKDMISSVIFDPKARTQLFSNIKKNIQQYTGTGTKPHIENASNRPVETDVGHEGDGHSTPVSRTSYHLMGKNADSLNFSPKTVPELRKRSASDYDVIDNKTSKDLMRPIAEPQRSSTVAMSFSSLLAEGKKSKTEDSLSINSNSNSFEDVEESAVEPMLDKSGMMKSSSMEKTADNASPKQKLLSPVKIATSSTPIYLLSFLAYLAYLYFVLPLPFLMHIVISSFIFGVICSTLALCILTPQRPQLKEIKQPYVSQPIPYRIPKSVFNPDQAFKGWMNQIEIYEPDSYHVNATRSVFVTLEGKDLRLQTPNRNIPRRAAFGEGNIQLLNVVHHKIWDITKAKVYLVPYGLVKKRVWSKKYPICIEFPPNKPHRSKSTHKKGQMQDHQDSFDIISDDDLIEKIYLFGRTQRQKEEWFYRFQRAIHLAKANTPTKLESATDEVDIPSTDHAFHGVNDVLKTYHDYYTSMCRLLPDPTVYTTERSGSSPRTKHDGTVNIDQSRGVNYFVSSSSHDALPEVILSQPRHITIPSHRAGEPGLEVAWFNVVVGRVMFDFLRRPKWANWLSTKIQKKLEKIRLPYFMEGLKLTEMDLGTTIPLAHKISLPRLDSQGIWLDMDITYNGAVQMTLETKMVLTKLGKKDSAISVDKKGHEEKSAITNSEEEDSAESSDDDESMFTSPLASSTLQNLLPGDTPLFQSKDKHQKSKSPQPSTSSTPQQEKRWVRIVDSITKSKYFQKATENSYIKKKLETVSNTPLILMAELHQCQGTICVNIPPPPSDRIWYGFKDHPHMVLKAHPKLGERAVKTSAITDWIEKKLVQEFNKVLLMPNMDDIPIPLMFNNLEQSS
uniref:testis-expressed protein 2-like n=1 Tax=Styela clava TaxID=7725 RepID=UPI00193A853E|nr:testis-expressed protein 2-like [Styela clava]XP_039265391.1 testis-expressed protein 2-like [Styela clava]